MKRDASKKIGGVGSEVLPSTLARDRRPTITRKAQICSNVVDLQAPRVHSRWSIEYVRDRVGFCSRSRELELEALRGGRRQDGDLGRTRGDCLREEGRGGAVDDVAVRILQIHSISQIRRWRIQMNRRTAVKDVGVNPDPQMNDDELIWQGPLDVVKVKAEPLFVTVYPATNRQYFLYLSQ